MRKAREGNFSEYILAIWKDVTKWRDLPNGKHPHSMNWAWCQAYPSMPFSISQKNI